ncbi:MAG: hypothetical protein DCC55_00540 [Chloroflexi bacterium]|nr:MAG: hypothetical protein DCC55_00540 [Chloroflexota bacterium]
MAEVKWSRWQLPVQYGLIAGVAVLYTALVGMMEVFRARAIISGVLRLDQVLIFAPPLIAALLVSRRSADAPSPLERLLMGAVVGLCASLPTVALLLLNTVVNVRQMFVSVSPTLVNLLTFEQELPAGIALLIGSLVLFGIAGALLPLVPHRLRPSLIAAATITLGLGLLSEVPIQIIRQSGGTAAVRTYFSANALRPATALAIFVIVLLVFVLWQWQRENVRKRYNSLGVSGQYALKRTGLGLLFILLLALPWIVGLFLSEVLVNVGIYVLMGLGLNIAVGLAGLLDLGYVTNFAVGAYVMGTLTSTGPLGIGQFNFWLILPVSVLSAMLTGFLLALPVLRMRGDYLAIATLGFGEIIRLLALSDWLRPYIGGTQGMLFIPSAQIFGITLGGPQQIYYLILGACFLTLFVMIRLNSSRTGRQWMALREDEDAAAAMGIDTIQTKVLAFTLSAAAGGLAGGIFATKLGAIFPHSFNLLISINTLSIIIVGGMGSIPGIVLGALALVGLPELLREFAEYRLLMYGAALIAMMLLRPEGLWPSAVRRRELYEQTASTVEETRALTTPVAASD